MIDTVLGGAGLDRWLFTALLAFTASGVAIGAGATVMALRRGRSAVSAMPFVALAAAGAIGFVGAIEVTRNASPFSSVELLGQRDLLLEYRLLATYLLAGALAVVMAGFVLVVLVGVARRQSGGLRASILGSLVAVLSVLGVTWGLVVWLDGVTHVVSQGEHPFDVRTGEIAPADLILGGVNFPISIAAAPTGEVFYAEHFSGRVGLLSLDGDQYQDSTFAMVPKPEDARLFHLTVHPQWPAQPYIYATVQRAGSGGNPQQLDVVRIEAQGRTSIAIDTVVAGLPTEDPTRGGGHDHYGAAIAACGEYLYVSVGDTDSPERAPDRYQPGRVRFEVQSFSTAIGKILRYRLEGGDVVPDGVVGDPPVFALGFRNPFDMACDPASGLPFVFDNGNRGHDQVRFATPGSNHGWPLSDERIDMTPPVYSTRLTPLGATGVGARTMGDVTEIFFSGFNTAAVYRLTVDPESHDLLEPPVLVHDRDDALLALTTDAQGCVWIASPSAIWRIREPGCAATEGGAVPAASLDAAGSPAAFFASACAACHGLDREGGVGPALVPGRLTMPDDFYVETILGGRPNTAMPAWGEAGLSEADARILVGFLRTKVE